METERNEETTAESDAYSKKLDVLYDFYEVTFAAARLGIPPRTAGRLVEEIMALNMHSGWNSKRDSALIEAYMRDMASAEGRADVGDCRLSGDDCRDSE